ncbi:MAG TPA: hypothetical protein VIV56_01895 [Gemmatimonadales bacterium]
MTEPVTCERCGSIAEAEWVDVGTMVDVGFVRIMGRSNCTRPGCVDEFGSTAVLPPERPGELTRDDQMWLRRQRFLLHEIGRVSRALSEAM